MAIYYEEFDTTAAGLVSALQTKIAAHADWDALTPTALTFTNTASFASTAIAASSVAGLFIGQRLKWTVSSTTYARTITDIVGLTVSISQGIGVTTPISTTITADNNLVKATTTRGAEMIVDLQAGSDQSEMYRLGIRFWRTMPAAYGSANTAEMAERFIWWRNSGTGSASNPVHVVLSVSKEHLFIGLEGPRWNETNPVSTTYGSPRHYAFITDVVPYHAADTVPFVCVGASSFTGGPTPSTLNGSHEVDISRNYANTASWQAGRLGTISFPTTQLTETISLTRDCTIDGKTYLFPYVLASNAEGMRGRLARIFFAGSTHPSPFQDIGEPVGSKVSYDGVTYKLLAVNKSENQNAAWGPLGAAGNNNSTVIYRSIVAAVPFSEP